MTTINQNMIAIVHSYPHPLCAANSLSHVITSSFMQPVHDEAALRAIEKDGMANHWYIPHPPAGGGGTLITRSISETIALAESIRRRMIPHIVETLTLTESVRRRMIPKISETLTLTESVRRKMIPKITGETLTLSESVRRRMIPHIAETLHLAETITRKMIPKVAGETLHLAESILRKMIPHIAETITLAESIKKKVFKPITETLHLAETDTRKMIPHITGETIHLAESIRRRMIPHITETLTLAESVKKKVFHPISETLHLAETITRKMIPHITGETIHLSESFLRRMIPHIAETLTLSESVKKKVIHPISETLHLSESILRKMIPHIAGETLHLSESVLRKMIPKISETLHLAESFLRKMIPKIAGEVLNLAESISAIKIPGGKHIFETIQLAETEVRKMIPRIGCQLYRVTVAEGLTLSESVLRKPKPSIVESLHLSENILRKPIRNISETLSINETILHLNFYEPLYIYPDWFNGAGYHWLPLLNAATANPSIKYVAVINVNSGPDVAQNTDYVHGITDLHNAGIKVLGYTPTQFGNAPGGRTISAVEADVDSWYSFYSNLDGIMFDQMDNQSGRSESYYSTITAYVKGKSSTAMVFGNPGTSVPQSYVGTVDTILINETATEPSVSSLKTNTFYHTYDRMEFGVVVYNQATLDTSYLNSIAPYVGYVYFTDANLPNPYNVLPTYLTSFITTLTQTVVYVVRLRYIRPIVETLHLADIIKIGGQFVIMIHETLTLTESVLRKPKPHIAGETIHLAESFLRKIPHNFAETLTLSESTRKKVIKPIIEAVNITECHVHNIVGHGMHVFNFIFHDKWRDNPPKRYKINVEESIKLTEKVETEENGPSYLWKFAPLWKAMGRTKK